MTAETAAQHPAAPATEQPVVTVSQLRKTYGDTVAVDDVSFSVRRGEIFGILGPNGAGKTTTVESLAGLRRPDSGSVQILGLDPQHDGTAVRELLGVQLQESLLQPKIRVIEALRLYAAFYPDPQDPEVLLQMLGLQDKRATAYEDLSGGQKQRLSIALALIGRPQVAILDELTTGLDPQARRETWSLVEKVRDSGVTIILVTHFMDEAERLCDRLIVIDRGRIIAEGSPAELAAQAREGRGFRMQLPAGALEALGGAAIDGLDALTALPAVTDARTVGDEIEITGSDAVLPEVIATLYQHGIIPDAVRTGAGSLEDAFVELVSHESKEIK